MREPKKGDWEMMFVAYVATLPTIQVTFLKVTKDELVFLYILGSD